MMLIRHELPTLPNRYHVGRNFESPIWLPVRTLSLIVRMICSELPFKYCARSGHPWPAPWILAGSATGSREAVLGVFAKLFEDRLEGRLEDETICQCEIGGYAMDFLIGQAIDVDVTRQPAPQAAIGVFDSALLPRGISIAEPGGHGAHALSKSCWAKAVSLSKVIDLRSAGFMRAKIGSMTKIVSAAVFSASRAARVTRDLRSWRTSTGRVRTQMMRSPSQWPASVLASMFFGRWWMETRSLIVSREDLDRGGRWRLWRRVR